MAVNYTPTPPVAGASRATKEVELWTDIGDTLPDIDSRLDTLEAAPDSDEQTAAEVPITDAGGYFTGTDVEAALQELGAGGGGGGTDLGWFDVTDAAYGATGDGSTDDTAAIQAAIDAAEAAGGGVVYFPAGVYIVGGALQDTSRSNAQLLLPSISTVGGEQVSIEFRGAFPPPPILSVESDSPLPDGHSVIKGTLNAGVGGALLGGWGPSGSSEDRTRVLARFRDLTFRLPSNPVLTALDLRRATGADLDHVVIDCGSYYVSNLTEPTTNTSVGIKMPRNNNGAFSRLGAVNVIGYYHGFQFYEHTVAQQIAAWGCKQGALFKEAANHASYIQRFMAVHCEWGISFDGYHPVDIAQFDIEHAADASWRVTDYDINDPSNFGVGTITWHVVLAGSGPDTTFTVNGGANLNTSQLGDAPAGGGSGTPTKVGARVYRNTSNQSIPNGTQTAVQFNAENYDTDSLHDNATNNTRLTIPTTGLWLLQGSIDFAANTTGFRGVNFYLNGTTFLAGTILDPGDPVSRLQASTMEELTAGDYIELLALQDTGGALDVNFGRQKTWFAATLIGV